MKQCLLFPCALALAVLLSACRPGTAEDPAPPEPEGPIQLESLALEVPRAGLSAQVLAQAVRGLPEALKEALADHGVEVETVTVTVGSSPSATAQAAAEGGVDLAFLPAADLAALENPPALILAAGPASRTPGAGGADGTSRPGAPALICAAPTEYGASLAGKKTALTWEEASRARWGLLEEGNQLGRQAVDLWLWDSYGKTTADLKNAAVYDSYEALFRAAAAGEIDLLPLWDGPRQEWAEAWTMDTSRTDSRGVRGLGRPAAMDEELPVLAVTERFYTSAALVGPGDEVLAGDRFASALAEAVNSLLPEQPVFGPYDYAPAGTAALDAQRRLANLG